MNHRNNVIISVGTEETLTKLNSFLMKILSILAIEVMVSLISVLNLRNSRTILEAGLYLCSKGLSRLG